MRPSGSARSLAFLTSLRQSLKYRAMQSANASSAQIDNVFRALADPTRRAIIERLADSPASVSELAMPFDMSLPAIYQHLQMLRDAGLVETIKAGRVRTCR